jgi:hypothetical protein
MQAWVEQTSLPVGAHVLLLKHCCDAQSVAAAHGYPPGDKHVPILHLPLEQSGSAPHAAHTLAAQRPLLHDASSAQASPLRSLHKPAPQLPLKQSVSCAQASPKCPLFCAATHAPETSQTACMKQKLAGSSTPGGSFAHVPTWPGSAHDSHEAVQDAAQAGGG